MADHREREVMSAGIAEYEEFATVRQTELTAARLREQALQNEVARYRQMVGDMVALLPCTCQSCDYFGCDGCVKCENL